ncbi:MAG: 2-amino-4-hydroxy-6-hydroxymethyldihydropteridine diphosphokinase [bacterium]
MRQMSRVFVAFGANLHLMADTLSETLRKAAESLAATDLVVLQMSRLFATPSFPPGSGPDYVNAAALLETTLDPESLLQRLHQVEAQFGRERLQRWGQRTLDLDLLAMDDLVLPDAATQDQWRTLPPDQQSIRAPDQLILPHPRLQDRAFVLVPLADVAPEWRHPRLGLTVLQMLGRLDPDDIAAVKPL